MPKVPKPHTASTKAIPSSKANTSIKDSPSKWIRSEKRFPLPGYVKEAIQKLTEAGHIAFIVGGSVRDFLLGREVKDHDIATSAHPDEVMKIFPEAIPVGKAFGVVKVPIGTNLPLLEIATFRQDLEYLDHRHPQGVVFTGPVQDASRRDFTINGLFYDPKTSQILDATGGFEDLKNGIIRAIGSPRERFKEDALRLLRAIRFKTRLGFKFDPETRTAIQERARLISQVSAERIRDELTLMWMGPRPHESLALLSELGLLPTILPELEEIRVRSQSTWGHLLKVMSCLDKQNPVRSATLSWMAILHEVEGLKKVETTTDRLKMSKVESGRIVAMIADQLKFKEVFQMREATLQRFIRLEYFEELLSFHKADAAALDGNLAYYEFCSSRLEAFKKSSLEMPKLIDGRDLIQIGFQPGPEFTEILRGVEDLALEKKLTSKEEALEYVIKNYVK